MQHHRFETEEMHATIVNVKCISSRFGVPSRCVNVNVPKSQLNLIVFCPHPTAKEEEKQKLMKWSAELKLEREQLEQRVKHLSNSITVSFLFFCPVYLTFPCTMTHSERFKQFTQNEKSVFIYSPSNLYKMSLFC